MVVVTISPCSGTSRTSVSSPGFCWCCLTYSIYLYSYLHSCKGVILLSCVKVFWMLTDLFLTPFRSCFLSYCFFCNVSHRIAKLSTNSLLGKWTRYKYIKGRKISILNLWVLMGLYFLAWSHSAFFFSLLITFTVFTQFLFYKFPEMAERCSPPTPPFSFKCSVTPLVLTRSQRSHLYNAAFSVCAVQEHLGGRTDSLHH